MEFLNRGTIDSLWWTFCCRVHCRIAAFLASTHPVSPPSGCDNQKCLQPLLNVPWEEKLLPIENHCYREKRILIIEFYIFIAFQFKKASACFNAIEKKKKRERKKKIRRGKERERRREGGREAGREGGFRENEGMKKEQVLSTGVSVISQGCLYVRIACQHLRLNVCKSELSGFLPKHAPSLCSSFCY